MVFPQTMKGMTRAKREWDHKLKIKHLFMGHDETPPLADTKRMAVEVMAAIELLQQKADGGLREDLAEVLGQFRDVASCADAEDASKQFNDSLDALYDQGDYMKRIWIE